MLADHFASLLLLQHGTSAHWEVLLITTKTSRAMLTVIALVLMPSTPADPLLTNRAVIHPVNPSFI